MGKVGVDWVEGLVVGERVGYEGIWERLGGVGV